MSETSYIQVPFSAPWRVRRNPLFRFMHQQYVDAFFDDGTIRLSTFAEFAKHPDEQRRDNKEGSGFASHNDLDVNDGEGFHVSGYLNTGMNAYIFCASMICNDSMKAKYGSTGLTILDTVGFAYEVSRYIPGFRSGAEGPCIYQEFRHIRRNINDLNLDDLKVDPSSNDISGDKLLATINSIAGDDLMFVKTMAFFEELEYRLAWFTSEAVEGALILKCPEARKYCESFK